MNPILSLSRSAGIIKTLRKELSKTYGPKRPVKPIFSEKA
jgi:hypothetical protein